MRGFIVLRFHYLTQVICLALYCRRPDQRLLALLQPMAA
jgi:hypothetical protein